MLLVLTDLRDHIGRSLEAIMRIALRPDRCSDGASVVKHLVDEPGCVELVGHAYFLPDRGGEWELAFGLRAAFDADGEARLRVCLDPKVRRPMDTVGFLTSIDDAEWAFELETSLAALGILVPRADDQSLHARVLRRLAATSEELHPWSDAMKREIERTIDAPVPELLAVFFAHHLRGGLGPPNGTLSLADRREGCFWERLVKFRRQAWIPAFEYGCTYCVLVDARDPEAGVILDGELGTYRLDLTLDALLEQWLAGTLDVRAWFIEGEPGPIVRFGDRVARVPPPAIGVRGTRLHVP